MIAQTLFASGAAALTLSASLVPSYQDMTPRAAPAIFTDCVMSAVPSFKGFRIAVVNLDRIGAAKVIVYDRNNTEVVRVQDAPTPGGVSLLRPATRLFAPAISGLQGEPEPTEDALFASAAAIRPCQAAALRPAPQ